MTSLKKQGNSYKAYDSIYTMPIDIWLRVHDTSDLSKGVFVFEVFISDASRGIKQPEAFDLPDGTIFCSMKINNEDIWKRVKSGEVKGIIRGFL